MRVFLVAVAQPLGDLGVGAEFGCRRGEFGLKRPQRRGFSVKRAFLLGDGVGWQTSHRTATGSDCACRDMHGGHDHEER